MHLRCASRDSAREMTARDAQQGIELTHLPPRRVRREEAGDSSLPEAQIPGDAGALCTWQPLRVHKLSFCLRTHTGGSAPIHFKC